MNINMNILISENGSDGFRIGVLDEGFSMVTVSREGEILGVRTVVGDVVEMLGDLEMQRAFDSIEMEAFAIINKKGSKA